MKLHYIVDSPDDEIVRALVKKTLPAMAKWAKRTITALPENERKAPGYRDFYTNENNVAAWFHPRSNCAERIEAFLFLNQYLKEQKYFDCAVHFADAMTDDPARGIYRGKYEEGHGQVWYWRDSGTYMTNYTMRVPGGMLALYDKTNIEKYREAALFSGDALLRYQQETGILREGWFPPETDPEVAKLYVTQNKINSRVGYAIGAFANLADFTGETKYFDAMEKLCKGIIANLYDDGSLPEDIFTNKIGAFSPYKKGHFMNYVINGVGDALEIFPENSKLRQLATRLGTYLTNTSFQSWGNFYGDLYDWSEAEKNVWRCAAADGASGLIKSGTALNRDDFLQAGTSLAVNGMLRVIDCPENPDYDGGFALWTAPDKYQYPQIGGHFHFFTILGLKAIANFNNL